MWCDAAFAVLALLLIIILPFVAVLWKVFR